MAAACSIKKSSSGTHLRQCDCSQEERRQSGRAARSYHRIIKKAFGFECRSTVVIGRWPRTALTTPHAFDLQNGDRYSTAYERYPSSRKAEGWRSFRQLIARHRGGGSRHHRRDDSSWVTARWPQGDRVREGGRLLRSRRRDGVHWRSARIYATTEFVRTRSPPACWRREPSPDESLLGRFQSGQQGGGAVGGIAAIPAVGARVGLHRVPSLGLPPRDCLMESSSLGSHWRAIRRRPKVLNFDSLIAASLRQMQVRLYPPHQQHIAGRQSCTRGCDADDVVWTVIACDGIHSKARRLLLGEQPVRAHGPRCPRAFLPGKFYNLHSFNLPRGRAVEIGMLHE